MLTPDQLKAREGKLTASMVAPLMTGDEQKLMDLWRLMVGDPDYVAENLDNVWPVQLGSATEHLNLDWYEKKYQCKVSRRGQVISMIGTEWAACTLDGWVE